MNFKTRSIKNIISFLALLIVVSSCQKLARPPLGDYPLDPPTPPYNALKSSFSFENNTTDDGEDKLTSTSSNITYVAGVTGQAMNVGSLGYLLFELKDTIKDANEFISVPLDTLTNLGSYTIAFWMNGAGDVGNGGSISTGAQGLFAISNKDQFWGNIEIFLENYTDATDANAVWMKIHMFNVNSTLAAGGEVWTDDDHMKLKNVLHKWTHIALTYDASSSTLVVYKDGVAEDTKVIDGGNYGKLKFTGVQGMVLGSYAFQTTPSLTNHGPESWAQSFNGALDQFHLYNRAFSAAEVTDLFTTKQ